MAHDIGLTTTAIHAAFAEEISAIGGTVADVFDDGKRLFARSVLPGAREVAPKDRVRGGVALRATAEDIWVHPYIFRQVCSNGAIIAHAVQSRRVEGVDSLSPAQAEWAVREAVRACCAEECFTAFAEEMRSAREVEADLALNLMPLLARLKDSGDAGALGQIMDRFFKDADSSRFGLMNAVTSVARDTSDPDLRWRLEEFGGGFLSGLPMTPAGNGGRVKRAARVLQAIA